MPKIVSTVSKSMYNNNMKNETMEIAYYLVQKYPDFFLDKSQKQISTARPTNLGRLRLNKYLHIISSYYKKQFNEVLKTNEKTWKAERFGGVFITHYDYENIFIKEKKYKNATIELNKKQIDFIDNICDELSFLDIKQIIDLSHEDPEWRNAHNNWKDNKNHPDLAEFNFSLES